MENLLTVVVPVYNDEKNFGRCIESLLNQSYKNFEIVIVDDASTDNTNNIASFYSKYENIRLISMTENHGVSHSRNIGIKNSNTPYITFIDSDDWIDITTYERCMKKIIGNYDVLTFGLAYDYVNFNHRELKYVYSQDITISGSYALKIYAHTIPNELKITPIVNNKIYKADFLKNNSFLFHEDIRYQEDDIFTFEILTKALKVNFVPDCFYHYCQREDSTIHCVSDFSINNFNEAYRCLWNYLVNNNLSEKYKKEFYLKLKSSFYGVIKRTIENEPKRELQQKYIAELIATFIETFDLDDFLGAVDLSKLTRIL